MITNERRRAIMVAGFATSSSQLPNHHRRKMPSVPREGTCAVGSLLSWVVVVTIGLAPILVYWLARVIGQALRRKGPSPTADSPRAEPEEGERGQRRDAAPPGKAALRAHPPTREPTSC
jgi:hypothetical protein